MSTVWLHEGHAKLHHVHWAGSAPQACGPSACKSACLSCWGQGLVGVVGEGGSGGDGGRGGGAGLTKGAGSEAARGSAGAGGGGCVGCVGAVGTLFERLGVCSVCGEAVRVAFAGAWCECDSACAAWSRVCSAVRIEMRCEKDYSGSLLLGSTGRVAVLGSAVGSCWVGCAGALCDRVLASGGWVTAGGLRCVWVARFARASRHPRSM